MIRHLLKLVWNRKRVNGLMIVEIFLSFLVVFAVTAFAVHSWSNYSRPMGFSADRVWGVAVRMDRPWSEEIGPSQVRTMHALLNEARSLEEIELAAAAEGLPYDGNRSWTSRDIEDRNVGSQVGWVDDGFAEVMQIRMVAGRWFEPGDRAMGWKPIVINEVLARDLFGDADPLGQTTLLGWGKEDKKVVGVIRDFRKNGDLSAPGNYLFRRKQMDDETEQPIGDLALKVKPGVTAAFEEKLVQRLSRIAPNWSFEVRSLDAARESYMREKLAPLLVVGVVAASLLLMVALGLIGVLWQNVTQRTREIGLRRAMGAARANIHRQIVTELLLITTLGVVLGAIAVVQVPLLGLIEQIRLAEYGVALLVSLVGIYLLAGVCALYPSWLATRVQPAEALHHE